MSFTIGSLFDGSGGFPLAASMCGGIPKWASEIEPYPIAVTKSRFPNMKHLGSVTDINGGEVEPVDVITFGSPCQDLSVAGKRAGLKHEANGDDETTRSGLFMEAVRIIKEMREATNGVYPRFAVWENVPGAFSSNKGEDFRIVLEELIKVVEPTAVMPPVPEKGWPYADSYCGDGWSIAYRTVNAQYWGKSIRDRNTGNLLKRGTPQRRRRIYLVADFRGECAGEILFKSQGLRGYFETGRTLWQTVEGDAETGSGAADCESDCIIYTRGYGGNVTVDGVSPTLEARAGTGGNNQPIVAYSINHQGGNIEQIIEDKTGTLTAAMNSSGNNKLSVAYGVTTKGNGDAFISEERHTAVSCGGGKGALIQEDMSATLATNNDQYLFQPICFEPGAASRLGGYCYENKCGTLRATMGDNQFAVAMVDSIGGQAEHGWVGETGPCLKASHYKFAPVVAFQTYQKVTGPLMANSHPGSYTGQDAFSDMLVAGKKETPIVLDRAFFNQGQNAQYDPQYYTDGTVPTLIAKGPAADCCGVDCRNATEYPELTGALQADAAHNLNSNNVVRIQYIVRRLTPTECARLQGFPDKWGHPIEKTKLTDEEYQFWLNVRNTHAAINDKATKEYTKDQMLKWYNSLHTDSAEYKMWGNGIALPNALYVMQGIADVMSEEKASRKKWLDDFLGDCL